MRFPFADVLQAAKVLPAARAAAYCAQQPPAGVWAHCCPFSPCPAPPPQAVHSLFVQAKTSSLPASREKYASSKFAAVSQLGTADNLPEWLFAQ